MGGCYVCEDYVVVIVPFGCRRQHLGTGGEAVDLVVELVGRHHSVHEDGVDGAREEEEGKLNGVESGERREDCSSVTSGGEDEDAQDEGGERTNESGGEGADETGLEPGVHVGGTGGV